MSPLEIPCPQCGNLPPPICACPPLPPGPEDPPPIAPPADEKPKLKANVIKVRREKRNGREVIVLEGFPLGGYDLKNLAGTLRKRCGTGGTVKKGTIEIQGDHRDVIADVLLAEGFRSKRAGG